MNFPEATSPIDASIGPVNIPKSTLPFCHWQCTSPQCTWIWENLLDGWMHLLRSLLTTIGPCSKSWEMGQLHKNKSRKISGARLWRHESLAIHSRGISSAITPDSRQRKGCSLLKCFPTYLFRFIMDFAWLPSGMTALTTNWFKSPILSTRSAFEPQYILPNEFSNYPQSNPCD